MSKDDFGFFGMTLAVLMVFAGAIVASEWAWFRHSERMAELGYEEAVLPGRSCTVWRKSPQPLAVLPTGEMPDQIRQYLATNAPIDLHEYVTTNMYSITNLPDYYIAVTSTGAMTNVTEAAK